MTRAALVLAAPVITLPDLRADPSRCDVRWKGRPVRLSLTETAILVLLTERAGVLKTRDQILDALSDDGAVADRCIDTHIRRIRQKFRVIDPEFDGIRTVYGVGYAWGSEA